MINRSTGRASIRHPSFVEEYRRARIAAFASRAAIALPATTVATILLIVSLDRAAVRDSDLLRMLIFVVPYMTMDIMAGSILVRRWPQIVAGRLLPTRVRGRPVLIAPESGFTGVPGRSATLVAMGGLVGLLSEAIGAGAAVRATALAGMLLTIALVLAAAPALLPPRVVLRDDALVLRRPLGSLTIPWEILRPEWPTEVGQETLLVQVRRKGLVGRRGLVLPPKSWRIPVYTRDLAVSPWTLAEAIERRVPVRGGTPSAARAR